MHKYSNDWRMHQAFQSLKKITTRVVILWKWWKEAFVAGADIAEFADFSVEEAFN
jgi:enoyl-CoA hydratase